MGEHASNGERYQHNWDEYQSIKHRSGDKLIGLQTLAAPEQVAASHREVQAG
jgi:hypothetical protein